MASTCKCIRERTLILWSGLVLFGAGFGACTLTLDTSALIQACVRNTDCPTGLRCTEGTCLPPVLDGGDVSSLDGGPPDREEDAGGQPFPSDGGGNRPPLDGGMPDASLVDAGLGAGDAGSRSEEDAGSPESMDAGGLDAAVTAPVDAGSADAAMVASDGGAMGGSDGGTSDSGGASVRHDGGDAPPDAGAGSGTSPDGGA